MRKKVHFNNLFSIKNVSVFIIGFFSVCLFFFILNYRSKSVLSNSMVDNSVVVKSLYDFVKLDTQSSNGIYYYNGSNVNNNMIFANKCWQIVRTTSNNGVKLIYNGEAVNGQCTSSVNYINNDKVVYNDEANKITSVGYMYGDYDYSSINFYTETQAGSYMGGGTGTEFIYGEDAVLNSDGTYTLTNAKSYTATSDWQMGNTHKYTCFVPDTNKAYNGTTDYLCGDSVYITAYIISSGNIMQSGTAYYISLPNTESYYQEDYTSLLADFTVGSFIPDTSYTATWAFATDATYNASTGEYSLAGTVTNYDMSGWSTSHSAIDNSHFTCFRVDGVSCENLYYVIYSGEGGLYFFKIKGQSDLTNYKNSTYLDLILQDNSNDSNVKEIVDNWYVSNLLGSEDEEYIIDDIYYNDRVISDYGGWIVGNSTTNLAYFQAYNRTTFDVGLNDTYDSFSKSSANAKLTYPIGLLSYDEALMSGATSSSSSYLGTNEFWLSTPYSFVEYKEADNTGEGTYYYEMKSSVYSISNSGVLSSSYVDSTNYVRPVISINQEVPVTGSGTPDDPYRIVESYNVTYSFVGDSPKITIPATAEYAEGSEVELDTSITVGQVYSGYVFNGWTSSDVTISDNKFVMPSNEVSIVGTWTKFVLPTLEVTPRLERNNMLGNIYFDVVVTNSSTYSLDNVKVEVDNPVCLSSTTCSVSDNVITINTLAAGESYTFRAYVLADDVGTYTVSAVITGLSRENSHLSVDDATPVSASASTMAALKVCNNVSGEGNGSVAQYKITGYRNVEIEDFSDVWYESWYSDDEYSSEFVLSDNTCETYLLSTDYSYYIEQIERKEYSLESVSGVEENSWGRYEFEPKKYELNFNNVFEDKKYFHSWDRKENDIKIDYHPE